MQFIRVYYAAYPESSEQKVAALLSLNMDPAHYPVFPASAGLRLNRCNLPAEVHGSVLFQKSPQPLELDGVAELHRAFFRSLQPVTQLESRALCFRYYMSACFLLDHPEQAGFSPAGKMPRRKADYLRLLRGWMFDADSQEAAVLKGWAESRFGLRTRYHRGLLGEEDSETWRAYQQQRARGLYNTNALEAQLDLLYAWCQYELQHRFPGRRHLPLYRGANGWRQHEILQSLGDKRYVLLLNNLNSFTSSKDCAHAFGDHLLQVEVPLARVVWFPGLLPGVLPGEEEYLVLGGLAEVERLNG